MRLNCRASSKATSSSSRGTNVGSISTTVTLEPKAFHSVANSTPIAPPPMMTTDAGNVSCKMASWYVSIFLPSAAIPGIRLGRAPVATTMCLASSVSEPPSEDVTSTVERPLHHGRPHVDLDVVLLHQEIHALGQPVGNLPRAFDRRAIIQRQMVERKSELLAAMAQHIGHFRALEERFGGDAADVHAHSPQPLPIDDRSPQPKLGGANGAYITAGTRAYDNDIVRWVIHTYSACRKGIGIPLPSEKNYPHPCAALVSTAAINES